MHSMTGFGRGSATNEWGIATIELSSLNRKQAEVICQIGREFSAIEPVIRKTILTQVSRGRVQVNVSLTPADDAPSPVEVDTQLTEGLERAFRKISEQLGRVVRPEAADFIRTPGIIRLEDSGLDPDQALELIQPALADALDQLIASRAAEGADLAEDLGTRIHTLEALKSSIEGRAPRRPEHLRELLFKRLRDLGLELDLDDERVLREVALFADRCDISEEITRLESHLSRFRGYLEDDQPTGRSLDFLCQEIHREFNTIGSKASDAEIAQTVVSAKTELEKIREQVQNVE